MLQLASAIFAIAAAVLWLVSATVKLPNNFPITVTSLHTMMDQLIGAQIVSSGSSSELDQLGQAMIRQSRWSAWAAGCAAVAAVCQAIPILRPFFQGI
jgi:hypothetical protein